MWYATMVTCRLAERQDKHVHCATPWQPQFLASPLPLPARAKDAVGPSLWGPSLRHFPQCPMGLGV